MRDATHLGPNGTVANTWCSPVNGWPLTEPIMQTAAYAFADGAAASAAAAAGSPLYARDGLPNVRSFERAVARWEGADDAVAVASGMAALSLVLLAFLSAGDRILVATDLYAETSDLLHRHLLRFGIVTETVDFADRLALTTALTRMPAMVLVETIANPGLYLNDLVTICTAAHAAGALVCVDNTFASPALCRPLDVGADLVLQSAGKLLAGHHDVTAGVVAGSHELIARLRRDAQLFGGTLAPIEAWLAVRGMQTLRQRMAWISHSAARLLPLVLAHPAVTAVRYPGRPTRSAPAATIQQLLPNGAGGLIAIQLGGGQPAADRFTSALRTIPYAATVGGPTTTVSFPPMRHDARRIAGVAPTSGLVRISLGLEEPSELEDEFRYALDAILALNLCSEELVG